MACILVDGEIQGSFTIDKEIVNSLHSYKPFSKYLSNG